ncbi:MAG: copper chaperone PCu(A)C [Nitrososphaerales archaeon]
MRNFGALRMMLAAAIVTLVAVSLAAGCTSRPAAGLVVTPSGLAIRDAYARPAPAGGMGGAFLTVVNSGKAADRLVAARTPVAQSVELHETIDDNGVMKMRPVAGGYEIPANGKLELKPGGKHLMFVGLGTPLKVGEELEITLTFEKAGDVSIKAPIHE